MHEEYVAGVSLGFLVIFALAAIATSNPNPKQYSLTFNNDPTFETGPITLLIDNNNGQSQKHISIYGLDNKTNVKIFGTFLSDDKQSVIADMKFDGNQTLNITKITHTPRVVTASIVINQGGLFKGRMMIATAVNSFSIPITVSTEPLVTSAILLVVVGVLLAIMLWELINYYSQQSNKKAGVSGLVEQTNQIIQARVQRLKERYSNSSDTGKQMILNLGSIFFAITIGLFALPNSSYITSLRVIDPTAIVVLLGIGLGIGSLRQFLEKI